MANPQIQNSPIYKLPLLDIYGLNLSYVSNTSLSISAGQCRDSNDIMDIALGSAPLNGAPTSAPFIIDATKIGAGGLDQGTVLLASHMYLVYMIADSRYIKPVSAVISAQQNGLQMPFGYDSFRLIGWISTDSSAHFNPFISYGNGNERTIQYVSPPVVLSGGAATTLTTVTLFPVVPYTSFGKVLFQVKVNTASAANETAQFRPLSSASVFEFISLGYNGNFAQFTMIPISVSTNVAIQYQLSAAANNIDVFVQAFDFTV